MTRKRFLCCIAFALVLCGCSTRDLAWNKNANPEARKTVLESMPSSVRNVDSQGLHSGERGMEDLYWDTADSTIVPGRVIVAFLYPYNNRKTRPIQANPDLFLVDVENRTAQVVAFGRWEELKSYMNPCYKFDIREEAQSLHPEWFIREKTSTAGVSSPPTSAAPASLTGAGPTGAGTKDVPLELDISSLVKPFVDEYGFKSVEFEASGKTTLSYFFGQGLNIISVDDKTTPVRLSFSFFFFPDSYFEKYPDDSWAIKITRQSTLYCKMLVDGIVGHDSGEWVGTCLSQVQLKDDGGTISKDVGAFCFTFCRENISNYYFSVSKTTIQ